MRAMQKEREKQGLGIALTRDQLVTVADLENVRDEILNEIRRQRAGSSGAAGKKWLKSREVRKLLEISPGKLHAMRANKLISYMRIGGIIYYDSAEIEKMFEKARSPAA